MDEIDDQYVNYWGVTRIRNPKTLQSWIDRGWYANTIAEGFIFNTGCGRFREYPCTCTKCRNSSNSPLDKVLKDNKLWTK